MSRLLLCLATFLMVLSSPVSSYALCSFPKALTGVWKANDGGTYYIRENGDEIWWVGRSKDGGKSWSNVYSGVRNGSSITGKWADVPMGKARGGGMMNLQINGTELTRTEVSGGFGGSQWSRECKDTVLNPVP